MVGCPKSARVEEGLGQHGAAAIDVSSNHIQIVYDSEFVESPARVLSQL
jgi:hypothetical protein